MVDGDKLSAALGGDRERVLAASNRHRGDALGASRPPAARTLFELADSYGRHGVLANLAAKLRIEDR
jgi:hypothetical protein